MSKKSMTKKLARATRALKANELLFEIGNCGHGFFYYPDHHGYTSFDVDLRGLIWLKDGYTGVRIYLHYPYWNRGFTEGGTLRSLIRQLKDYIFSGKQVHPSTFGPWPKSICDGDLWGYGDDMQTVKDHAVRLGIIKLEK